MATATATATSTREVVIDADHGTQFTSWAFTHRARQSGLVRV